MTMIDSGTYGARAQTLEDANPWERLKRLIEDNPGADEKALLAMYRDYLKSAEGEDYLDACIVYSFTNGYRALIHRQRWPSTARREQIDKTKSVIKARAVQLVLLDLLLPNGKPLRDCTGADCEVAGGWLLKVAVQVGDKIVGDVLSEERLQELFGA